MPAVSAEYDYYGYARRRQGVARNAAPVSRSTKAQSTVRRPTSEATKVATRNALRDDFIGGVTTTTKKKVSMQTVVATPTKQVTKKTTTKKKETNLDPVVFQKKEKVQKVEELKLKKMQVQKKKKEMEIARQKEKVLGIVKSAILSSMLFAIFFFICYRYTQINESFSDVNSVKAKLKEKETMNAQIESTIKQNTDLSYIESYAKYQLGMQKPKTSQIQKIVIEKEDKITTPIEIKEEVKEGKVSKILNNLLKIVD